MMPLPDFSSLVRTELMICVASFALKSKESTANAERIRICARGLWLRADGRLGGNNRGDVGVLGYRDGFGGSGRGKPLGSRGADSRSNRRISTRGRCPE